MMFFIIIACIILAGLFVEAAQKQSDLFASIVFCAGLTLLFIAFAVSS